MTAHSQFVTPSPTGIPRRAFVMMPLAFAGWLAYVERRERRLPDAAAEGNGSRVMLALFSEAGAPRGMVRVRKLVRPDTEWRRTLTADEFAITRRGATEPPFTGRYWNKHSAGLYRCVCCGSALFDARAKFDSGTGWPSFGKPIANENVFTRPDRSLAEVRQEVLCRKCEAHLGHVFPDGPPPTGQRYCLNSVALRLCQPS